MIDNQLNMCVRVGNFKRYILLEKLGLKVCIKAFQPKVYKYVFLNK